MNIEANIGNTPINVIQPTSSSSYNWKIIIAHHHIVDYIVIHELCHLKHPNHSPLYWKSVKHIMPDYQTCRQWLKFHRNELLV